MLECLQPDDLPGLSTETPLYGVIGWPVAHSLSPALQQPAFDACHLPALYIRLAIPPEQLTATIGELRRKPFAGWNCTLPHKLALAALVDERDISSLQLGGVNTVRNEKGHLTGFNTDGQGWVRAIRDDFNLEVRDLRILILGAGGAGQAIAKQAALEGCSKLLLANRTETKARELAGQLHFPGRSTAAAAVRVLPWDEKILAAELKGVDLVVNGTSLGLKPGDAPVLPSHVFHEGLCVYDTIYRPAETPLLKAARRAGARGANGLSMLLHQGALSFEIWTGQSAPLDLMRQSLQKAANFT